MAEATFELRTFNRIDSYDKFEDCLAKNPWVDPKVRAYVSDN